MVLEVGYNLIILNAMDFLIVDVLRSHEILSNIEIL